jgi:branched-chain amino acid transport system ATP-binding protein
MSSPQQASPPSTSVGGGEAALVIDGVTRRFGGSVALSGVSVILPQGGRLAVIGPNGAGKTTLFRVISGEMRVTEGAIRMFGEDVTRVSERGRARRGVARTFQVSNLFPSLSVADNVRIAAQARGAVPRRFWRKVREWDAMGERSRAILSRVGLERRAHDRVSDLSHGEQRQLEIAMALIGEPRILLLDEPAAGLSATERIVLRRLLEELPRDLSVLLIEHDMSLALELADEVLCLDNGVPLAHGTPAEIRANPAVQAVYLGRRE